MDLCPVLACIDKCCSFAHILPVPEGKFPALDPVPVSLSKDKNCKSHSSPFHRLFAPHPSKNLSSKLVGYSSTITNSSPLSFFTSSPSPHTEVLFSPRLQYAVLYSPYFTPNHRFLDGPESPFSPWQLPGNSRLTDHLHSTVIPNQANNIPVEKECSPSPDPSYSYSLLILTIRNKQLLALVTVLPTS